MVHFLFLFFNWIHITDSQVLGLAAFAGIRIAAAEVFDFHLVTFKRHFHQPEGWWYKKHCLQVVQDQMWCSMHVGQTTVEHFSQACRSLAQYCPSHVVQSINGSCLTLDPMLAEESSGDPQNSHSPVATLVIAFGSSCFIRSTTNSQFASNPVPKLR